MMSTTPPTGTKRTVGTQHLSWVAEIMDPIKYGTRFVVLDGANSMGELIAECTISDTATSVLSKLLLLQSTVVEQVLSGCKAAIPDST